MWTLETVSVLLPEVFPMVGAAFSACFMVMILVVLYKALRRADFSNLFVEEGGGMSLTKFWQNVAYAAATVAFLASNISGKLSGTSTEMIWIIYLGTVAGNAVMSQWIATRYNQPTQQKERDYYGDYNTYPPGRGRPQGPGYPRPGPMMPSGPPDRRSSVADPDA